jgi:hypothetical protein
LIPGEQIGQRWAAVTGDADGDPSRASRTASLVWNIRVDRPDSAAPTATRKATATFSGSSRPVLRLITAFPATAVSLSSRLAEAGP